MTFLLFKHYLFSKRSGALIRMISWICISGVAIGVAALIVVLSVMNGFGQGYMHRILSIEPHIVVDTINLKQENMILKWSKKDQNVKSTRFKQQDVIIRTDEGIHGAGIAYGISDARLKSVLTESKRNRVTFDTDLVPLEAQPESYKLKSDEIIMGVGLANSLGILEGQQVVLVSPEALLLPPGEIPPYEKVTVKSLAVTDVSDYDRL